MKKKSNGHDHGDLVVKKAMEGATGGLPKDEALNAVNDAVEGMKQLAKRFRDGGHEEVKSSEIPRAMSYLAKTVDEVARLVAFMQGGPDSRAEVQTAAAEETAYEEIFSRLTNEQFEIFHGWMREAKERKALNQPS